MERYLLLGSLYIDTKDQEDIFIDKISSALNCKFCFDSQDEEGEKRWIGENLGLNFFLTKNNVGRLKGIYSLNINPIKSLFQVVPKIIIDFHFIDLLKLNKIETVLSDQELREKLSSYKAI